MNIDLLGSVWCTVFNQFPLFKASWLAPINGNQICLHLRKNVILGSVSLVYISDPWKNFSGVFLILNTQLYALENFIHAIKKATCLKYTRIMSLHKSSFTFLFIKIKRKSLMELSFQAFNTSEFLKLSSHMNDRNLLMKIEKANLNFPICMILKLVLGS